MPSDESIDQIIVLIITLILIIILLTFDFYIQQVLQLRPPTHKSGTEIKILIGPTQNFHIV
jgi:hypothetical protein